MCSYSKNNKLDIHKYFMKEIISTKHKIIICYASFIGALLTGATLIVGRIKGIDRPALAGILPSYKSRLVLIDSGANTNCKPINLLQFTQMEWRRTDEIRWLEKLY